ncbi:MAG: type I-C CRISPR-associated protein Cas8c/Csd1 [Bacteroidetes bacterium]|nr:type I-C CRISPR-associated protein Cas8c/Csd1 [Bacteroidota bacterium]
MSWIEKLNETYENCKSEVGKEILNEKGELKSVLMPICHTSQNAQIEIVLDGDGIFLRAHVVSKSEKQTILPAVEGAAGRAGSKLAPLTIGDKLQYIAGDYTKFGGKKKSGFIKYKSRLERWSGSSFGLKHVNAVLNYISNECVISDLIDNKVLYYNVDQKDFPAKWDGEKKFKPAIFTVLQGDQLDSLVRFSVEIPGELQSNLWKNQLVWQSWIDFYLSNKVTEDNADIENAKDRLPADKKVFCYVEGIEANYAGNHPAKIRNAGDGAKIVSSNDSSGFTYRGRFLNDEQACSIGYEVSQRAHNALRWLISKQGYRDGDLAVISWGTNNQPVPNICYDSYSLNDNEEIYEEEDEAVIDTKEATANSISKRLAGYSAKLGPTADVVVMGINSATPGRISVSFYRELTGSDFLKRIEAWHTGCAWLQNYSKDKVFYGAPSPADIAVAAYGENLDDKLKRSTVERLLPSITDSSPIPKDIVISVVRKASNRNNIKHWRWEKTLGIACALYKYHKKEEGYTMALEKERTSRDYLFGRLLAVADSLEGFALSQTEKGRPTNAARMMQRFAEHPCSTWRTIELALSPHKARLGHKGTKYEKAIDEIMNSFVADEFSSDNSLSGEFLLGYHTQRSELMKSNKITETEEK